MGFKKKRLQRVTSYNSGSGNWTYLKGDLEFELGEEFGWIVLHHNIAHVYLGHIGAPWADMREATEKEIVQRDVKRSWDRRVMKKVPSSSE